MSQSEISTFWYQEAFKQIGSDLPHALKLYLKKFYLFWHGQEIINIKSLYYSSQYSWLTGVLLWKKIINFPSGLLFPLMFIGIYYGVMNLKKRAFVPVSYLILAVLVISLFFVCARFRQPIVPIACIFAVNGVSGLAGILGNKRQLHYLPSIALLGLIIILNWGGDVDSRENRSQFQVTLGSDYRAKNDLRNAIAAFQKSLDFVPDNIQAINLLGKSLLETGKAKQATQVYGEGFRLYPDYPPLDLGMAQAYQNQRNFSEARKYYHLALENSPSNQSALEQIAKMFEAEKNLDSAIFYYQQLYAVVDHDSPTSQKLRSRIEGLIKTKNMNR